MKNTNNSTADQIRATYPAGSRVELVSKDNPFTKQKPGDQGTVCYVDSMCTVFVKWDRGTGHCVASSFRHIRKL